ncbi:MAG: hypothetical protein LAT62_00125 [Natronospirillum sp.]|uniref:hypothetical protein n=1 Tax=Natronospirillum sp. TaxID=2812955 RepID=UPI0025DEEC2C|nr:hypothetical protein [Natronospirillum sp.]MCH8550306.1 hypothetical protein [Natronospirillum sp.]
MRQSFVIAVLLAFILGSSALADPSEEFRVNLGLTSLGGDSGNLEDVEGRFAEGAILLRRQFFSTLDVPLALRLSRKDMHDEDGIGDVSLWRLRGGLGYSTRPSSGAGVYVQGQVEILHARFAETDVTRGYPRAEAGLTGELSGSPWQLGVIASGYEEDVDRFPVLGHVSLFTGLHEQVDWGLTLEGSHERIDLAFTFRWY